MDSLLKQHTTDTRIHTTKPTFIKVTNDTFTKANPQVSTTPSSTLHAIPNVDFAIDGGLDTYLEEEANKFKRAFSINDEQLLFWQRSLQEEMISHFARLNVEDITDCLLFVSFLVSIFVSNNQKNVIFLSVEAEFKNASIINPFSTETIQN